MNKKTAFIVEVKLFERMASITMFNDINVPLVVSVFYVENRIRKDSIWVEYTGGKQTYFQLAEKYGCCIKTIQRKIDAVRTDYRSTFPSIANVLMDTTYFGRKFGVMVFKDAISGEILYKQYVKHETNKLYLTGIEKIARRGIKIQSIICDGRKGLFQLFNDIPVQMCNFHQIAIIRRYLTKKPKMQASKELWEHTLLLTKRTNGLVL